MTTRISGPLENLLAPGESAQVEKTPWGGSLYWFTGPGKPRDGFSSDNCMISFHTLEPKTTRGVGAEKQQGWKAFEGAAITCVAPSGYSPDKKAMERGGGACYGTIESYSASPADLKLATLNIRRPHWLNPGQVKETCVLTEKDPRNKERDPPYLSWKNPMCIRTVTGSYAATADEVDFTDCVPEPHARSWIKGERLMDQCGSPAHDA